MFIHHSKERGGRIVFFLNLIQQCQVSPALGKLRYKKQQHHSLRPSDGGDKFIEEKQILN